MRLEDEGEWYVVATPCDQPVAFAPSIDDDEDDDWVIIQDDDPRMDAVFAVAERAVGEELEDCAMVRSALFPTLRGDLDDQLEDDDDDDVDDDEFARLDEEGEEDDAVLSLLATFDVPELGHAYDMMRIEELYQLIARRGDADDCLRVRHPRRGRVRGHRPRVAAALDEFQDDGGDDDDATTRLCKTRRPSYFADASLLWFLPRTLAALVARVSCVRRQFLAARRFGRASF